jgi:hypothetical protein
MVAASIRSATCLHSTLRFIAANGFDFDIVALIIYLIKHKISVHVHYNVMEKDITCSEYN